MQQMKRKKTDAYWTCETQEYLNKISHTKNILKLYLTCPVQKMPMIKTFLQIPNPTHAITQEIEIPLNRGLSS